MCAALQPALKTIIDRIIRRAAEMRGSRWEITVDVVLPGPWREPLVEEPTTYVHAKSHSYSPLKERYWETDVRLTGTLPNARS